MPTKTTSRQNRTSRKQRERTACFSDKRIEFAVVKVKNERTVKCNFYDFGGKADLSFEFNIDDKSGDILDQVAPFERDRKYFYFKRFMPVFSASGTIKVGKSQYTLKEENTSVYIDSTYYSKPRLHSYQRLTADYMRGENRFSLNLASRVGDNRNGSENSFFLNGELHKLYKIEVKIMTAELTVRGTSKAELKQST